MKARYQFICLICSFILVTLSCSDNDDVEKGELNDSLIKEIVSQEKTHTRFVYNSSGKIAESQSVFFYKRFTYDAMNRLVKEENAADPELLSSAYRPWANKTELMSSANCEISNYQLFTYNQSGQLASIENYQKKEADFSYGSKRSYEYDENKIIRLNYHTHDGEINTYNIYEYDERGNVIRTKYYSTNYHGSSNPTLISETTHKYDTMNNPFQVFKETGDPGLYTNPNNVIETTSITHVEIPGFEKPTTSKTSYQYNQNGYPIKVMDESGSQWQYIY